MLQLDTVFVWFDSIRNKYRVQSLPCNITHVCIVIIILNVFFCQAQTLRTVRISNYQLVHHMKRKKLHDLLLLVSRSLIKDLTTIFISVSLQPFFVCICARTFCRLPLLGPQLWEVAPIDSLAYSGTSLIRTTIFGPWVTTINRFRCICNSKAGTIKKILKECKKICMFGSEQKAVILFIATGIFEKVPV